MDWTFDGPIVYWRGPAPWYFVPLPSDLAAELAYLAPTVTYGWGCMSAVVTMGESTYETSVVPKDGGYLVPVKVAVRRAEGVDEGDVVSLRLVIGQ